MRFVLQVYFNGAQHRVDRLPDDEREAVTREYIAFFRSPAVLDGNQLQPPATAVTVRVKGGEAVALAARIPAARMGGAVEVRPVVER